MSRANEISVDTLVSQISEELTAYQKSVIDKIMVEETQKAMKDLVKKTKATAPVGKRSKHYRDNITSKVLHTSDKGYGLSYREVWYVKGSDYRISHLLNNGHAKKSGGRVPGTNFITNATKEIESAYLANLQAAIENGGN